MSKKEGKTCICADDFGLSNSICMGILDLVKKQKIQAVSCIVNKDSFNKNYKKLKIYSKNIDIGLHINLTELDDRINLKFNNIFNIFSSLFLIISKKKIEEEILLQLNIFKKYFKFEPKFIDGHHHIHQIPFIRDSVIKVINKKKTKVRYCGDRVSSIILKKTNVVKSLIIFFFSFGFKKKMIENKVSHNLSFSGIYDFNSKFSYDKIFDKFLKYRSQKHLIMCHPAKKNLRDNYKDKILGSRLIEYKFFMSDNFNKIIKRKKIKLSLFSKF
jgi:chitin disaccharide deacetylase